MHCEISHVRRLTALTNTGVAGAVGRAARARDRAGGDLHPQPGRGGGENTEYRPLIGQHSQY